MQNVLYTLLMTDRTIQSMTGGSIDWDVAVQGITGPHIVMFLISEPRTYRMNGEVRHYMTRVQFDCRATSALARRQLADALDAFLSGYKGVFGGIQFDGCFKDGHRTRFDMDGNTRWFQAQIDYRIFWAPAQG